MTLKGKISKFVLIRFMSTLVHVFSLSAVKVDEREVTKMMHGLLEKKNTVFSAALERFC